MEDVPFGTIELHDDEICLHNLALIDPRAVDLILSLMEDLLGVIDFHPGANLRHILIVPDVDIVSAVHFALHRLGGPFDADIDGLRQLIKTASIPALRDSELTSYIIVNEALPRSLTPATAYNLDTVANILESFLHASIHGLIRSHCQADSKALQLALATAGTAEWCGEDLKQSCEKRLSPKAGGGRGSLHELAAKTVEAYVVYRTKIALMSENALVQLEPEADLRAAVPRHPADIAARLDQVADELRGVIDNAALHKVGPREGWCHARRVLFRGLLDPLSRHTAYVEHSPGNVALADEPRHSGFYQSVVAPFWTRMRPELELAYTNSTETAASIETSEALLKMFLAQLGITHSGEQDGDSRILFDRRWSGCA